MFRNRGCTAELGTLSHRNFLLLASLEVLMSAVFRLFRKKATGDKIKEYYIKGFFAIFCNA